MANDIKWVFELIDSFSNPAKEATEQLEKLNAGVMKNINAINKLASANRAATRAYHEINPAAKAAAQAEVKAAKQAEQAAQAASNSLKTAIMKSSLLGSSFKALAAAGLGVGLLVATFEAVKSAIEITIDVAKKYLGVIKEMITVAAHGESLDFAINLVLDPKSAKEYQEYINRIVKNTSLNPQEIKSAAQPLLAQTRDARGTAQAIDFVNQILTRTGQGNDIGAIKGKLDVLARAATREGIPGRALVSLIEGTGVTEKEFLKATGKTQKEFGEIGNIPFQKLLGYLAKIQEQIDPGHLAGQAPRDLSKTTEGSIKRIEALPTRYFDALKDDKSFPALSKSLKGLADTLSPESSTGQAISNGLSYIFSAASDRIKLFLESLTPEKIDRLVVLFTKTIPDILTRFYDVVLRVINLLDFVLPHRSKSETGLTQKDVDSYNLRTIAERQQSQAEVFQKLGISGTPGLFGIGYSGKEQQDKLLNAFKTGQVTSEEYSAGAGIPLDKVPKLLNAFKTGQVTSEEYSAGAGIPLDKVPKLQLNNFNPNNSPLVLKSDVGTTVHNFMDFKFNVEGNVDESNAASIAKDLGKQVTDWFKNNTPGTSAPKNEDQSAQNGG